MPGIYYAVVEDDPLDNGGNSQVLQGAPHSLIEGPDGRKRAQAHLGHSAWCSVCRSAGDIAAGADIPDWLRGWDGQLKAMEAVEGDIVLCKCERPPRIIAIYGRSCTYFDSARETPTPDLSADDSQQLPQEAHHQQFTLVDGTNRILADTYYTVRMQSGDMKHGVTDSEGRTARYQTHGAQGIRLYVGHRITIP